MKKQPIYYVLVSFIFAMMFVGTAAAAPEIILTFTPTRDFRTPPPTPTTGGPGFQIGSGSGTDSFDCPSGQVGGYGQVTPDAMWLSVCGHCLPTSTAFPTFDFNDFPTATDYVAGGTPLPPVCLTVPSGGEVCNTNTPGYSSPTVTALPSATTAPTQSLGSCSLNTSQLYLVKDSFTYGGNETVVCSWNQATFEQYGQGLKLSVDVDNTWISGYSPCTVQMLFHSSNNQGITVYSSIVSASAAAVNSSSSILPLNYVNVMAGSQTSYQWSAGASVSLNWELFDVTSSGPTNIKLNVIFYPSATIPDCSVTPTPLATATPGVNYCDSINNGFGDLTDQQIDFWSPSGAPSCLIIPAFNTYDLFNFDQIPTWLGLLLGGAIQVERIQEMIEGALFGWQIYTKAFTICLQPYEFLPVYLFGNVLLVSTVVDIGMGLYILNVLTKR